jgi:stearoyl-CoA desaturase (delta-9 desaturase)
VNSICHTFGTRDYQTRDASRNNFIVGLFAFGEGWHNNHHAFPRSAFHGLRWWQVDISGYIITAMEKLGLVWNVQRVKEEDLHKRVIA